MTDELYDFQEFMERRKAASDAYVQGEMQPLSEIIARTLAATFFAPTGGSVQGASDVASRYASDVKVFERGSNFRFEVLQIAASDGIAYWVGFMRGEARMHGKPDPIPMDLRVTEIFRREHGEWKMVHRHADPLHERKPAR